MSAGFGSIFLLDVRKWLAGSSTFERFKKLAGEGSCTGSCTCKRSCLLPTCWCALARRSALVHGPPPSSSRESPADTLHLSGQPRGPRGRSNCPLQFDESGRPLRYRSLQMGVRPVRLVIWDGVTRPGCLPRGRARNVARCHGNGAALPHLAPAPAGVDRDVTVWCVGTAPTVQITADGRSIRSAGHVRLWNQPGMLA